MNCMICGERFTAADTVVTLGAVIEDTMTISVKPTGHVHLEHFVLQESER